MHAIFLTGGQQYRVEEGQTVKVEKLELATGSTVEFDQIMLTSNGDDVKVGAPYVDGAKVTATVVKHARGKKIKVIKFRRRKNSRTQQGHRQWYTELKITGIKA